jgi:hypothetical protein
MPYHSTILTMAANLLEEMGRNKNVHESRFHMLWNSILFQHFPLDKQYGIGPQTSMTGTGTKSEFIVVKIARAQEHVVVVVELKKPAEETPAGKENVVKEIVDYIEERFDQTNFPSIYGIAGIGLSWTCFRMDRTGGSDPHILVEWRSTVTTTADYDLLCQVVSEIHNMTSPEVC